METSKDYYATLGVLPSAEGVVIRAAYKALAQRYHPDRFEGSKEEALRRMQDINEAYAVLSDPVQRKEYDALRGADTKSGASYSADDSNDVPPGYDPLESDWAAATKYYPDLVQVEARLTKIAWRLGYAFRAYLLDNKAFETCQQVRAEARERAKVIDADRERQYQRALNGSSVWVVQLGSYSNPDNVTLLLNKLRQVGVPTFLEREGTGAALRARVRAGPFPTQAAAEQARSRIKNIGIDGPVVKQEK
jgi:curved DNA-binding protein CbpA